MSSLKFTLKAWPVIAAATIGLCYLTQLVAGWFGIELPDQQNIDIVRKCGQHAFDSLKNFGVFALLCAQVIILLPAIEEIVFRWLLFRLPLRIVRKRGGETPPPQSITPMSQRTVPPASLQNVAQSGRGRLAPALSAFFSSALFSAAHYLAQPWPDAAFVALFFFGLAQCWLYCKTDRIWCAMLNHGLFNLTNLVLLFILPEA